MSIDIDAKMMVGVDYDNLPQNLKELSDDDFYEFIESNRLNFAILYYDAGLEGWCVGRMINNYIPEQRLDSWFITVKEAFKEVQEILKVKPELIATQHVC